MSAVPLKASESFPTLSGNLVALLVMKVADCLLVHKKKSAEKESPVHESKALLNERELHALHYLGGYVMHNLFKKIKKSKHYNSPSSKQPLSFL